MNKTLTLAELLKQREDLDAKIDEVKKVELAGIIADIKQKIETYGLTAHDLGFTPAKKSPAKKKSTSTAMTGDFYVNPANPNETYPVGKKGKPPAWFSELKKSGKDLSQFLKKATPAAE